MANQNDLKYSKHHVWVDMQGDVAVVGLTYHAQKELGAIVFMNLPQEGDEISIDEAVCDVESVKAISDVVSPFAGTVCEVNEELLDNPGVINKAPYDTWVFKVNNITETESLLTLEEYEALCNE